MKPSAQSLGCRSNLTLLCVVVAGFVCLGASPAFALIFGGEGNKPLDDPGWPAGAAAAFNHTSRVAYWEGPPFGGGQWHAECRGDAKAFNEVLQAFSQIKASSKRLKVHDGVGKSTWIHVDKDKQDGNADRTKIDWVFMVWVKTNWAQMQKMPANFRPPDVADDQTEPPIEIDVYAGGSIRWADVVMPLGIEVFDDRLEAHGFSPSDGTVLEGDISNLKGEPLAGRIELQKIETPKGGGYAYTKALETTANTNGHWVLTKVPTGWYRIAAFVDGYVPKLIGHANFEGQPSWHTYEGALVPPATVTGRVKDDAGKPLADVEVRLDEVICNGKRYDSAGDFKSKTDINGNFKFEGVPTGSTRAWPRKTGYCRPGLGLTIDTPAKDIDLTMSLAGQIHVVVDFGEAKRTGEYMVELTPEGGNVVGSWGGSSQVNDKNEVDFKDVPPGRYELVGHPNPSSENEKTESIWIDLKGGKSEEIKITPVVKPKPAAKKPRKKK